MPSAGHPLCFMHVHKCAGTSLRVALAAALPADSMPRMHIEAANFSGLDFDRLAPQVRRRIAVSEEEIASLGNYPAIVGHFTLPTLARFAPIENIATIIREPRARLLSHYLYLRLKVAARSEWPSFDLRPFAEGSLGAFLMEPRAAIASDNRLCRMLLHGHELIPADGFIGPEHHQELAEAAWERLSGLGFVGLFEEPESAWKGVGDHFGVTLRHVRNNVTGGEGLWPGMLPVPPFGGEETLRLLELRTGVDAILYRRAAERTAGEESARRRIEAAFADALVRFGAHTAEPREAVAATIEALDALRRSRSWRYTAPLRRLAQAWPRRRG